MKGKMHDNAPVLLRLHLSGQHSESAREIRAALRRQTFQDMTMTPGTRCGPHEAALRTRANQNEEVG